MSETRAVRDTFETTIDIDWSEETARAIMTADANEHEPVLGEAARTSTRPPKVVVRFEASCAALTRLLALLTALLFMSCSITELAVESAAAKCTTHAVCEVYIRVDQPPTPFERVVFCTFWRGQRTVRVRGFYDGGGVFVVRFSPDEEGRWFYHTSGDLPAFETSGSLNVLAAHGASGPAHAHGRHFQFADGSPYHSFGTTAYAWAHQARRTREATLSSLAKGPGRAINKMRMTVFPKWYPYNHEEPQTGLYPYRCSTNSIGCSRSTGGTDSWDFRSFDPRFWRHFEQQVAALQQISVVADLILFHPYDEGQWGFDCMGGRDPSSYNTSHDIHYLRYVVARLAAFSNVWWSMANEWDFVQCKRAGVGHTNESWGHKNVVAIASPVWDELFSVLVEEDPYGRERSIHNGKVMYNHSRPWIDHVSLQGHQDHTMAIRDEIGKPVVWDEVKYEGDIPFGWGALSGPGMASEFWHGLSLGAHVGHGETILEPGEVDDAQVLWWSKGGHLRGSSLLRVAWQQAYLATIPPVSTMETWPVEEDGCGDGSSVLVAEGDFALFHLRAGRHTGGACNLFLPGLRPGDAFRVTKLNWWVMTTTLLVNATIGPVALELGVYGVRLPANVELRRVYSRPIDVRVL